MVKAILSDKQLEILYEHFSETSVEQVSELLVDLYVDSAELIEYIAKNSVKRKTTPNSTGIPDTNKSKPGRYRLSQYPGRRYSRFRRKAGRGDHRL